jgi:hypothetical protein
VHVAQAPPGRHSGAPAGHSTAAAQPRQVSVPKSQTGVRPAQAPTFPGAHGTQVPAAVQTGAPAGQSRSAVQPRQVCVVASQICAVSPQSAAARQPTHAPAAGSQSGVAPAHRVRLLAEQAPHLPEGWQAGVARVQSASPAQTRQVWVVTSQVGRVASHWPSLRQATQLPDRASQTGVAPVQAVVFPLEQAVQAPLGWQAGMAPPQLASLVHPWQVLLVASQIGAVPPHCALVVHDRQMPLPTLQPGVGPVQSVVLLAEQMPQAPVGWQAGVAPPQSASPAQARQVCVAVLQTGVAPPHWAFV